LLSFLFYFIFNDPKCHTLVKNVNHVYRSSWKPFSYKLAFKGELYLRFVLFGIGADTMSSMELDAAH
jgi:hypothetical protein